jgi:hypothetical protein
VEKNCSYVASAPVILTLDQDIEISENMNKSLIECSIADVLNKYKQTADANRSNFTCETVEVVRFTAGSTNMVVQFLNIPNVCNTCATDGEKVMTKISEDPEKKRDLLNVNVNIKSLTVQGTVKPVEGLILNCDLIDKPCHQRQSLAGAFTRYNRTAYRFRPQLPGKYTFRAHVQDRCQKHSPPIVEVDAVCSRPRPTAEAMINNQKITYQNFTFSRDLTIDLDAGASFSPGYPQQKLQYLWCKKGSGGALDNAAFLDVDTNQEGGSRKSRTKFKVAHNKRTTPQGTDGVRYDVVLLVSDGCSYSQKTFTMNVQCNCPPRVHAGISKTLVAKVNQGPVVNEILSSDSVYPQRNSIGVDTRLTGRLTFNYEDKTVNEVERKLQDFELTYTWTLLSWANLAPAPDSVVLNGADNKQVYTFNPRIPIIPPEELPSVTLPATGPTTPVEVSDTVYERYMPKYIYSTTKDAENVVTAAHDATAYPEVLYNKAGAEIEGGKMLDAQAGFLDQLGCLKGTHNPVCQQALVQTAGFATRTKTTFETQQCVNTTVVNKVAQPVPSCIITLYNANKQDAFFEMTPTWKACQGVLRFQLKVEDGCTTSVDTVEIDVKCNKKPIAVACCDTVVVWSSVTQAFPVVTLDGRVMRHDNTFYETQYYPTATVVESTVVVPNMPVDSPLASDPKTQMSAPLLYMWSVNSAPKTWTVDSKLGKWSRESTLTLGEVKQGTYKMTLTVDDGCHNATDDVTVEAECIEITPEIKFESSNPSTQGTVQTQDSIPQYRVVTGTEVTFKVLDHEALYGKRGDRDNQLRVRWILEPYAALQNPTRAAIMQPPDRSIREEFKYVFLMKGDYRLRLQIWDDCWKDAPAMPETFKIISVTCTNEWTLPNPFLGAAWVTSPLVGAPNGVRPSDYVFNWDYQQKEYPLISIDTTVNNAIVPNAQYQFEVFINGNLNNPKQVISEKKGSGTFQYQPDVAGTYTFRVYVSDQCKTQIYDMPTAFTVGCGFTPEPQITGSENVAFGVTFDNFEYRVRYDNRKAGFYRVRLSCKESKMTGLPVSFKWRDVCKWNFENSNNLPTNTTEDGEITLQPIQKSGTDGRVTEKLFLTIEDGCKRDPQTSADISIRAVCSRPPLKLLDSTVRTFTSKWNGKSFDPVAIVGLIELPPDAALKAGDYITYQWSTVEGVLPAAVTLAANTIANVTYTPPAKPGRYTVTLVADDGCQKSEAQSFTVVCECIPMTPSIIARGEDSGGFRIIRWDGKKVRFPDVEIYGDLQYAGDYQGLEYTWTMITSPGNNLTCTKTKDIKSIWGVTERIECPTVTSTPRTYALQDETINDIKFKVSATETMTCTKTTTTSLKSDLNSLGSMNVLADYKNDWMVFTPDLKGKYEIMLTVNDQCQPKSARIEMFAACNDAPYPELAEEVQMITLNGTDAQRVFVDASRTTDREGDTLTYSWTLFYSERVLDNQGVQRTYRKVDTGYYTSNANGPIFSFIPDRQGSYIAELEVDDGCSSSKVNSSINVNCQASRITSDARVDYNKRIYQYGIDASERFATSYMDAFVSDECAQRYVEKEQRVEWSFVNHQCIDPEVVPTPAPVAPVEPCKKTLNYDWVLEEKPCTSMLSTVSIDNRKTKDPTLHPDVPGTYQLRLTVNDLCSKDNNTLITVNAKCSNDLTVTASQNKVSLNACGKNNEFDLVELEGSVKDVSRSRGSEGYPLPLHDGACAAAPTPSPTNAPAPFSPAGCCPACGDCPRCASCQGCTTNCNCGNTRGWQYECQPVTLTKTVLRRVSTLMAQNCIPGSKCTTTEVGSDYCPERCVKSPTCSCVWQAVMKNETIDVEETACDWARVPIQGIFNSYAAKKQTYERPTFKRMSSSAHKRAQVESPVSAAFISVMSALVVMLGVSVIVNVVYWRKIRALGTSMETASNLSVNSVDSNVSNESQ